jgi:hypothetical protein
LFSAQPVPKQKHEDRIIVKMAVNRGFMLMSVCKKYILILPFYREDKDM